MKQKKIPMRMCLGCQEMKPKKELIRVVKNKENEISLDFTGKKPGRGAYICKMFPVLRKPKRVENLKGPSRHPLVKRYMNYCEKNWRRAMLENRIYSFLGWPEKQTSWRQVMSHVKDC